MLWNQDLFLAILYVSSYPAVFPIYFVHFPPGPQTLVAEDINS